MSMFYTEHTSVDACFMTDKRVLGMRFHLCEFGIESLTEGLHNKNNKKHWEINAINMNNSSNKTNGKSEIQKRSNYSRNSQEVYQWIENALIV